MNIWQDCNPSFDIFLIPVSLENVFSQKIIATKHHYSHYKKQNKVNMPTWSVIIILGLVFKNFKSRLLPNNLILMIIDLGGRWVVWKRPKIPLRNIKMVTYLISHYHHSSITQATHVFKGGVLLFVSETDNFDQIGNFLVVHDLFVRSFTYVQQFT